LEIASKPVEVVDEEISQVGGRPRVSATLLTFSVVGQCFWMGFLSTVARKIDQRHG
jgi:hypothetical protein